MKPRRNLIIKLALGLVVLAALAPPVHGDGPWYAHYVRGLALIQSGEAQEARAELSRALELRPDPGLGLKTDGVNTVDYLPHLYLAIAAQMSGDQTAAREHFSRSEAAGVAALSERGKPLLNSYRPLLGVTPEEIAGEGLSVDRHNHAEHDTHEATLGHSEYQELGRTVLGRCGLDPETRFSEAPWYFHYELGLALAQKGDPQRALTALVDATDRHPNPDYSVRIYGMWFVDYQPYIEIAKLHAELGNWSCASDALKVSEQRGELSPEDPRVAEVASLKEELATRLFF